MPTRPSSRARSCWRARWCAGRDARRTGPGARACRRGGWRHDARRTPPNAGWPPTTTTWWPGAGTSTPTPSSGARSSPPRSSSPRTWPTPGLNPKVLPGGTGLDLRLRSRARAAHRAARRHGCVADGRPDRNALRVGGAQRRARLRPRRAHRGAARRGARAELGARTAGRCAADLPGRRGVDARRRDRRHRGGRDQRGVAHLRVALRSAAGRRAGRGAGRADHVCRRPHRGHAAQPGRAHLATASDRRPGVRARHPDHRPARRAVPSHRPAHQHRDGVGCRQRRASRPTRSRRPACSPGLSAPPTAIPG